jgi:hypothetical protein
LPATAVDLQIEIRRRLAGMIGPPEPPIHQQSHMMGLQNHVLLP